jgi:hypothetical protein
MESTMPEHVAAPRRSPHSLPDVSGIDLAFRPASYFWPLGLGTHLLARVKGAERKAALKRLIDQGRLDEVSNILAQSGLSNPKRQAIGQLYPALMGGEYLPDLSQNEVMIASITIASVTQDVTSVYAGRGKLRIYYRVVDEYEGETLGERSTRTSVRPLTLGQLESFFNAAWPLFSVLAMNVNDYDVDRMLRFIISIDSPFYPQIGALYKHRVRTWATARKADLGLDRVDAGDLSAGSDVRAE